MNKVIGIGVLGLLIYGAIRISKVKNVADSITTKLVNPRIHKISLSGMILRSEVKINNPTVDSLTLTKPVITLSSNGKTLMQSKSNGEELTIKPMAITMMDTIELQLGWTVLGSLVSGIVKKIPELILAFQTGTVANIADVLGIPMEMTFSTYSNGIFFQSTPVKIM